MDGSADGSDDDDDDDDANGGGGGRALENAASMPFLTSSSSNCNSYIKRDSVFRVKNPLK